MFVAGPLLLVPAAAALVVVPEAPWGSEDFNLTLVASTSEDFDLAIPD